MEIACQIFRNSSGSFGSWFRSAKSPATTTFNITVVKPHMGPIGVPLGDTYAGQGPGAELNQLGADLVNQSKLNSLDAGRSSSE